jgi:hypothetical protein
LFYFVGIKMNTVILNNILQKDLNIIIIKELCNHHWFLAFDKSKDRLYKVFSSKNNGFSILTFYNGKKNKISKLNFYGFLIFDIIKDRLNLNGEIDRLHWNMYFKKQDSETHTDKNFDGFKSILYNLHTTDGGIEIENKFYPDVMGQAKIFKSNLLHKGIGPTNDNVRFNLNIVFKEI